MLAGVQSVLGLVATAALIWHFVRRARNADPSERLRDAPVWWVGAATMVLFGALLISSLGPEEGNLDDLVYYCALAVLATVPLAFWFGVLRWRLSEAEIVAEENARLDAELQTRLAELHESRARIVEAGFAERRRVERDLHDGAQQRLLALALDLRLARSTLDRDPGAAAELLDAAAGGLTEATEELRELARGIHPPVLADRGLAAALDALASRSPVPVTVDTDEADGAPAAVEAAAYFVVSEALTNVARHANAASAVVKVRRSDGRLEVEVSDDGDGGADVGGRLWAARSVRPRGRAGRLARGRQRGGRRHGTARDYPDLEVVVGVGLADVEHPPWRPAGVVVRGEDREHGVVDAVAEELVGGELVRQVERLRGILEPGGPDAVDVAVVEVEDRVVR